MSPIGVDVIEWLGIRASGKVRVNTARFHMLLENCWLEQLNNYQLIKKFSDSCSSSIHIWMLKIKLISHSFVWTMTLIQPSPPLEGSQRPGGSQLVLRVIISPLTARAVVYVFLIPNYLLAYLDFATTAVESPVACLEKRNEKLISENKVIKG